MRKYNNSDNYPNSPLSSVDSSVFKEIVYMHENAKNSRTGIIENTRSHPLLIDPNQYYGTEEDLAEYMKRIQIEIEQRKLTRMEQPSNKVSENNELSNSETKNPKFRTPKPCPTFRVSSDENKGHDLKFENGTEKYDSSQSEYSCNKASASADKVIAYDMNCEESLMDFLDSSSGQFDDILVWENGVCKREMNYLIKEESEEDSDILDYVRNQKMKRDNGENVTGETIYTDDITGRIRNLHRGSVSITLYNSESDYDDDFGKSSVFHPIMTMKEKLMLGLIPNPGWKNKKLHQRTLGTNFKKTTKGSRILSAMKQQGILEITQIKIVAEDQCGPEKLKIRKRFMGDIHSSQEVDSNRNSLIVSENESITSVQKCFKDILLRALPNPNFEIKEKIGRKEYKLTSSECISNEKIEVLPKAKMTNLPEVMNFQNSNPNVIIKQPSTPHRVRKAKEHCAKVWTNPIGTIKPQYDRDMKSGDQITLIDMQEIDYATNTTAFECKTEVSQRNAEINDSNSGKRFLTSSEKLRKNNLPSYSARYRTHRPRPCPRATYSHRDYVKPKIISDQSCYTSNGSHSKAFKQSSRKQSGDATYRMRRPDERILSTEDHIQCQYHCDIFHNPRNLNKIVDKNSYCSTDCSASKRFTHSVFDEEVSDNGMSTIFSRKYYSSDASSDNKSPESCSSLDTSNTSSGTVQSCKKHYSGKWKTNRQFKFRTSASKPSDNTREKYRYDIPKPSSAENDASEGNYETDPGSGDNKFVQTLFYDFPLDNNGSSVAISVTLPFQIPVDSFPFDSPHCAYTILNRARKLLKKNCPYESNSSQSDENLNSALMPMRCFVDIEEMFSESESSSSLSSRESTKLSKPLDKITLTEASIEVQSPELSNSTRKMLDKEMQTSEFRFGEANEVRVPLKNRKIGSINCLKSFLFCIFCCGCLRKTYRVVPVTV